jgi:hypothetical protein
MIYVLELPPQRAPRAWFAFDPEDFARKLELGDTAELHAAGLARVYPDEAAALAAFERNTDPTWAGEGWRARWALREQLIANEVLAED